MAWSSDVVFLAARYVFTELGREDEGWWLGLCPFCTEKSGTNPEHLSANRLQRTHDCSARYNFDRSTWECVSPVNCNSPKKAGTIPNLIARLDQELPNWRTGH